MGDMGEVFREMTRYKKAKRKDNTHKSTKILQDRGVDFESKNGGAHLIVRKMIYVIDFWPSTGIWIDRATKVKKRGVFPLLKYIGTAQAVPRSKHNEPIRPEPKQDEGDPPW